jgi:hypothetical protein
VRLVVVEQRVVGRRREAECRGFLPLEHEHLFQQGLKEREVVGLAGFDPLLFAERGGAGEIFDQRLRELRLLVVLTAKLADHRASVAMRVGCEGAVGQLREPLADAGVGLPLVDFASEEGDLLGPIGSRCVRHLGAFVPLEEATNAGEQRGLARMGAEALIDFRGVLAHD